ncbi:DUF6588 family protein [Bacteroidota bacterium]
MKKLYLFLLLLVFQYPILLSGQERTVPEVEPNPMTIDLTRMLGKDIFELNGVPYLQPTVEAMNSTSNARFFNQAFVPSKVDKPYFRAGLHGMWGIVPKAMKTYAPKLPMEELTTENLLKYGTIDIDIINPENTTFSIDDTAGLIYAALKGMIYDGIKKDSLNVPPSAPTALGKGKVAFDLPSAVLDTLFRNLTIDVPILGKIKIYDYLPDDIKDSLSGIFEGFPDLFNLPEGGGLDYFYAVVPQVEIGALFGTELLLRGLPPVNMGEDIGDFAFWGIGLKHSISQYFNEGDEPEQRYFDMAVQVVYQGTFLKNSIGVTNADLEASANMWDFNIHASKHFEGIIDVYTGISYEMIDITSDYIYYLPIEMQWELGLIDKYNNEVEQGNPPNYKPTEKGDPNHPETLYDHLGDQNPQTATISLDDGSVKWVIGVSRQFGPIAVFIDYSVCKFNIFSGGIEYRF